MRVNFLLSNLSNSSCIILNKLIRKNDLMTNIDWIKNLSRKCCEECGVSMRKSEIFIVNARNYDFFIAITRNYATYFRNYGSQCDRNYGVIASQFHRNRTHGMFCESPFDLAEI